MTVHKFESSRKTTVEINEYKHIKRKNMKNNPQKKILRQDGFPIGAEMAKKRYSSAGTTTLFLKQLILTILLFALLPVSALAAEGAPNSLYVGDKSLSVANDSYWTTNDSGELTRVNDATDDSNDWNVKYDPSTATLTLSGATIQGGNNTVSAPYGSGIYALSRSGQPVSLTIKLIGENTITGDHGIFVNAEIDASIFGADASLTITGKGSLDVSGFNHGIYVKSGTGYASLNINDASVVAKTTQTYSGGSAGVCVQSSIRATSSPQLSLAVNGGSLTASGTEGNNGILFYVGDLSATNATTSLTVSNNAIVRANGSAGGITSNSSTGIQYETGSDSTGGIVFDGNSGTVYGDVTLQEDLEIGEGESLTIPQSASLNTNDKLTNDGTINVESGGKLNGEPGGTVVSAPTIGTSPKSLTVTEGETATFTVEATGGKLSYQWQQRTDSGQNWTDIKGATDATYSTGKTTTNMNGYQYRCVVSNSAGSVISDAVTVHVHTWGNPVWSWSEDGKNCMVTFTCANDETHTESPNATVTSEIKTPATCTETGVTTYTATVEFNGQTYTDTKDVADIPATGHDYENGYCTICGEKDPDYVEPEPEPEPTYYRVDLRPVEGATVILSADEVEEGGTLTFTIEIAEGYVADDLMVTVSQGIGKAVEVKPDEAGVYTVKEVDGLVTITVYGVTEEPATAIERVETLRIYAAEGILHVETPTRQRVTIVSMAGALIADGEQEGARIYRDLNAGVYIVRVGDYATKVRVE